MEIKKFGFYFLFLIIILVAIKFYAIIYDFFPSIAAGCVFAYLLNPIYLFLRKKTGHKSISAFLVILIIVFLVLIPITLVLVAFQKQMDTLFTDQTLANVKNTVDNINSFLTNKFNIDITERITSEIMPRAITGIQTALTSIGPWMLMSFTRLILFIFLTIFMMYYLLINSKSVVKTFQEYFPVTYKNSSLLLKEMGKNTKALIYGQILIASIQGSLGAIGFFIFGLPGAIFWGLIMTITSFLPLFGASIVWLPAALVLIMRGDYGKGVGLIMWGALVVGTIDNLLRPKLTGSLGKIHPVTVLLGVFIGLKEWGFIGIVIGPLIISVLLILIKMFREEYLVE